jgi:hypothetical protein
MAKYGVPTDSTDDPDELDDTNSWKATWELMDLAEAHWRDIDSM